MISVGGFENGFIVQTSNEKKPGIFIVRHPELTTRLLSLAATPTEDEPGPPDGRKDFRPLNDIFRRNEPMQSRITAQDSYDFDKCPHRVYLNRHGDASEKSPHSDFLNLLFDNAMTHEWDVVKMLDCSTPKGGSLEERAASTIDLMTRGVERIYQGVLLLPNESGIPDLLERMNGRSSLGDYYYSPVDIKAGTGYADPHSGRLREDYGMQLFHYGKLLDAIQNKFPPRGEILNRRRERISYELTQFESAYVAAENEILELIMGSQSDAPALCGECDKCQWWGKCEKELIASNDITLLADIGRAKKMST